MSAFDYPAAALARRHGPGGYARYESYRAWLRDEFSFRCVYCLSREQWGRATGEFDLDHFVAQATRPTAKTTYDNLVYSCTRCNLTKSAQRVPDPAVLTTENVRLQPDGSLAGNSDDVQCLILKLDLNSPQLVSWRLLWMRIVDLAQVEDPALYLRIMGFPADLPNLGRLRPPGGNSRPAGIANSHFTRAARGLLPATY